jgi:hypothetical protein
MSLARHPPVASHYVFEADLEPDAETSEMQCCKIEICDREARSSRDPDVTALNLPTNILERHDVEPGS